MTPHEEIVEQKLCVCGRYGCTIPYGICHCGCGRQTALSRRDDPRRGYIKGVPRKFCYRHKRFIPIPEEAVPFKIGGVYCRLIPLSRGLHTIVWESDYLWLMQWKWSAWKNPITKKYYAFRVGQMVNKKSGPGVWMARQILGLGPGDPNEVDHIEPDGTLDNRRSNLRFANRSDQGCNKRKQSNNTSGFKGVVKDTDSRSWRAEIKKNGKRFYLGSFRSREEAYAAYCEAAKRHHGEFARIDP